MTLVQLVTVVAPQSRAANAERLRNRLTGHASLGGFRNQRAELGVTTRSERAQPTEEPLGHISIRLPRDVNG